MSKLRTRFNTIKNQGDPGPGAKQLMQQTLEGTGSELAEALKFVDEQMLTGMTDSQKSAVRPILVRPLMQTFAVIIKPTETEVNKVWLAQVYQPFNQNLAIKFPFSNDSRAEASNEEIGQVFGPEGAIAKFVTTTMGPLVVRRGDSVEPRKWADMGIHLAPAVVSSVPGWLAPLGSAGVAPVAQQAKQETQKLFDLQAIGATSATEFTIEIDGQALRWRGQQQPWVHMAWPNQQGVPGVRITAITPAGATVVLLNEPGPHGLQKMIESAKRSKKDGMFELSWNNAGVTVTANVKVVGERPMPAAAAASPSQGFRRLKLPESIIAAAPPAGAATSVGGAQ